MVPRVSLALLLLVAVLREALAVHDSLNFVIHSGKRSCFYEHYAAGGAPRTIDAFVQSGSGAQLQIYGPLTPDEIREETFKGLPVLLAKIETAKESVSDTQSFTHDFVPSLEGTYALCLDNSQSSFMDNVVQLDVRYGPKESRYEIARIKSKGGGQEAAAAAPDEDLLKSLESISRLRKSLVSIQIEQLRDRRRLNLYSENNRTNRSEMVIASLAETAVFVLAAVFQIYFVRNWFAKRAAAVAQNGNPTGGTKLSA